MSKRKKILILGGEGFVGRNLADSLLKKYDCHSADIEESKFERGKRKDNFIKTNPYKNKIENDYDAIIHLVDSGESGGIFEKNESRLIKNIGLNKKNHLIIVSSAAVYSSPNSDYGKRKTALEKIYSDYCDKNRIKLTIFRLFNTYGPYQIPNRQGSLIANILVNYLNKKTTEINDKAAMRDFIFSGDIGKFVHYAIQNSITGTIDLATNRLILINEMIKAIEKNVVKKKLPLVYKNIKENSICPSAKNKLLKKIKITSLNDGFKKTLFFYKKNIKIINGL
ncbi:MAG: NAD(P)-dependent oxidoreductase [bacterium]|nr:NAD(P)-dependent oxidoreductase [bacterium]